MLMILLRLILMPLLILAFLVTSLFARLVFRSEAKRRACHRNITSFFSSVALRLLRIHVTVSGQGGAMVPTTALFVSNHLSYLDILVMSAHFPSLFITSMEVKQTPFLGLMADMGGSLFIERRTRKNIDREIDVIADALRQGFAVTLYPESTSTDGRSVLPLKRPLLKAAIVAGVPVQPVVLAYRSIDGQPFGDGNRDRVCWYGDMSFLPHFLGLFTLREIQLELQVLPAVYPSPGDSRKDICNLIDPEIRHAYETLIGHHGHQTRHLSPTPSELYIG